jgi:hypothetical protein
MPCKVRSHALGAVAGAMGVDLRKLSYPPLTVY